MSAGATIRQSTILSRRRAEFHICIHCRLVLRRHLHGLPSSRLFHWSRPSFFPSSSLSLHSASSFTTTKTPSNSVKLAYNEHAIQLREAFIIALKSKSTKKLEIAYNNIDTYFHDIRRSKEELVVLSHEHMSAALDRLRVQMDGNELLTRIFSDMSNYGYQPTLSDHTAYVSGLALAHGKAVDAYEHLMRLIGNEIYPGYFAYFAVLQGLVQEEQYTHASNLWTSMESLLLKMSTDHDGQEIQLDPKINIIALKIFIQVRNAPRIKELLVYIQENGSNSQIMHSRRLALEAYMSMRTWDGAAVAAFKLQNETSYVDAAAWDSLISYAAKMPNGGFVQAMEMFNEMTKRSTPETCHISTLAKHAINSQDVVEIEKLISGHLLQDDEELRGARIQMKLIESGFNEARRLFDEMRDEKQAISELGPKSLIMAAIAEEKLDEALDIYREAVESEIKQDMSIVAFLLNTLAMKNDSQSISMVISDIVKYSSEVLPTKPKGIFGLFGSKSSKSISNFSKVTKSRAKIFNVNEYEIRQLLLALFMGFQNPHLARKFHDKLFSAFPSQFTETVYQYIINSLLPKPLTENDSPPDTAFQSRNSIYFNDNKIGLANVVFELLTHMRRYRIPIRLRLYRLLFSRFSNERYFYPTAIHHIEALMRTDPIIDPVHLQLSLMSAYGRIGEVERVIKLWREIWDQRDSPPDYGYPHINVMSIAISTILDSFGYAMGSKPIKIIFKDSLSPSFMLSPKEDKARYVAKIDNIWSVLTRRKPPRDGKAVPNLTENNWDAYIECQGRIGNIENVINAVTCDIIDYSIRNKEAPVKITEKMLDVACKFCLYWTVNVNKAYTQAGVDMTVDFTKQLKDKVEETWKDSPRLREYTLCIAKYSPEDPFTKEK